MSARGKPSTPAAIPTARSVSYSRTNSKRNIATPQSPHKTGVVRRTGCDGDGGTAGWKTTDHTIARRLALTARLEKPTISSTLRAASNRNKGGLVQKSASPRKQKPPTLDKKDFDHLATEMRQNVQRKVAPKKKEEVNTQQQTYDSDRQRKKVTLDTGVQTNEAEIMDQEQLVGDDKILLPSPDLARQIDVARADLSKKNIKPTLRTFLSYEQNEEQHLDELKQYMERTYVTKRKPKKPEDPILAHYQQHQYGTVFETMDELFTRDVQRAESLTDIKERIKRKEVELMNMFNCVNEGISDKLESDSGGE